MSEHALAVSVVIPARNAAAFLDGCLRSVRRQDYPPDRFEILVADNGSTDGTAAIARSHGLQPLAVARPGAAAARNAAAAVARHPLIAFLDSDAEAEAGWLRHLVAPFQDPGVTIVGGRIEPFRVVTGPETHAAVRGVLKQQDFLRGFPPYMLPFAATANAAIRADALRAADGFDETLRICEDADLAWRIQWRGGRLAYAEDAVVRHHNRSGRREYFRQTFDYGRGTVRLFAKHRRRLGRRVWLDWNLYGEILWAVVRLPVAPLLARTGWGRVEPLYDLAAGLCFWSGRLCESAKHKVIAI